MPKHFSFLKYSFFAAFAVLLTFLFHEFGHWCAGEFLGYKMIMGLNSTYPDDHEFHTEWHDILVTGTGPLFTVLQAVLAFLLLKNFGNELIYPFLFVPFYFRLWGAGTSFAFPNDESRIGDMLGNGSYTLPLIVCVLLFLLVFKASRENKFNTKFQMITITAASVFMFALIIFDQSFHFKIIG